MALLVFFFVLEQDSLTSLLRLLLSGFVHPGGWGWGEPATLLLPVFGDEIQLYAGQGCSDTTTMLRECFLRDHCVFIEGEKGGKVAGEAFWSRVLTTKRRRRCFPPTPSLLTS